MLIIADENMPYVRDWFEPYGEVRTFPGRTITASELRNADALLVRSVTRVDAELLRGSPIRFVGSATSGIEHMDVSYLQSREIGCASAPGCNATAVVEYVLSCLCALDGVFEKLLSGGVVGILGLGNVGARLMKRLQDMDIHCVGYDPLLAHAHKSSLQRCDLDAVLQADVICCHTPLTTTGTYPTWHLLDERRLQNLRKDAVLINAGRGAVVDNAALLKILHQRDDLRFVLDVWESEPIIDLSLLQRVSLATPHIAGYSWDGKVAGTRMVLEAFCGFFNLPLPAQQKNPASPTLDVVSNASGNTLLKSAIQAVYDVRRDDCAMRSALLQCNVTEIPAVFDGLRKNYPQRREMAACEIDGWKSLSLSDQSLLRRSGFRPFADI